MTGNTRKLADKIHEILPKESCDYFGTADAQGTESELLYIGFWTDNGNADSDTLDFLSKKKTGIKYTKKGKQKMYAAYNTALGYEMQDSIDTALEWALKAQTLAREKSKTDKKETGEIHNGTISYYIFISMYVDELEKRKEGMARLNMQMNRFDDDF